PRSGRALVRRGRDSPPGEGDSRSSRRTAGAHLQSRPRRAAADFSGQRNRAGRRGPRVWRATSAMSDAQPHRRRIAVIGGGITGLAAAHRLIELDPTCDVSLFESSAAVGGVLRTERQDGFLLELSADNFITNVPWAHDLCRRIGIAGQLLETNAANRRALV